MLPRSKGWIVTTPYTGAQQATPRTKPQLHVGIKAGSEPSSAAVIETVQQMSPEQLHAAIHKAKAVTARYGARIKLGHPPRELSQVRELLQAMSSVHALAHSERELGSVGIRSDESLQASTAALHHAIV
jgi:hypothetical protein